MRVVYFYHPRKTDPFFKASTYVEFLEKIRYIANDDRELLAGSPYGRRTYVVRVWQRWRLDEINPFWIKFFGIPKRLSNPPKGADERRKRRRLTLEKSSVERNERKSKGGAKLPREKTTLGKNFPSPRAKQYPYLSVSTGARRTYQGGVLTNTTVDSTPRFWIDKTRTSVVTPGFRFKKKYEYPWNNYSHFYYSGKESEGALVGSTWTSWRDEGYIRGYYGFSYSSYKSVCQQSTTNVKAYASAYGKALSRAKSMSVNLAQAYAERQQTARLLQSSVNRLIQLALALRKGDTKRASNLIQTFRSSKKLSILNKDGDRVIGQRLTRIVKKPSKKVSAETFANLWLEYQYGWRPLLSDIYGACELIANTYYLRKPVQVSAKSKQTNTYTYVPYSNTYTSVSFNEVAVVEDETVAKVVLQFREDDDAWRFLSTTGITDPALLAWELLPYSFVIDWFVPVGNYIKSFGAVRGMQFLRGSVSTASVRKVTSQLVRTAGVGSVKSTITAKGELKSRTIISSIPLPPSPSFEPSMGVERILSAISLLTQVVSRGKTTLR